MDKLDLNLDTMSVEDLHELSGVLEDLSNYAAEKVAAMDRRAEGKIEEALRHEAACERIYEKLPEWAKW